MPSSMKLYSYWRSSAAYRVRIALGLKDLVYDYYPVHLAQGGGEQFGSEYSALEPQNQVPLLRDGERVIRQSMAIMEYLEESYELSGASLMPRQVRERARARGLAQLIASDVHPLGNLRVLKYLESELGLDQAARLRWIQHWLNRGLSAFEALIADHPSTGEYCEGDAPTIADCCLIPQLYNARRFKLDMSAYPTISRIEATCLQHPAFEAAHPSAQPDAPAA